MGIDSSFGQFESCDDKQPNTTNLFCNSPVDAEAMEHEIVYVEEEDSVQQNQFSSRNIKECSEDGDGENEKEKKEKEKKNAKGEQVHTRDSCSRNCDDNSDDDNLEEEYGAFFAAVEEEDNRKKQREREKEENRKKRKRKRIRRTYSDSAIPAKFNEWARLGQEIDMSREDSVLGHAFQLITHFKERKLRLQFLSMRKQRIQRQREVAASRIADKLRTQALEEVKAKLTNSTDQRQHQHQTTTTSKSKESFVGKEDTFPPCSSSPSSSRKNEVLTPKNKPRRVQPTPPQSNGNHHHHRKRSPSILEGSSCQQEHQILTEIPIINTKDVNNNSSSSLSSLRIQSSLQLLQCNNNSGTEVAETKTHYLQKHGSQMSCRKQKQNLEQFPKTTGGLDEAMTTKLLEKVVANAIVMSPVVARAQRLRKKRRERAATNPISSFLPEIIEEGEEILKEKIREEDFSISTNAMPIPSVHVNDFDTCVNMSFNDIEVAPQSSSQSVSSCSLSKQLQGHQMYATSPKRIPTPPSNGRRATLTLPNSLDNDDSHPEPLCIQPIQSPTSNGELHSFRRHSSPNPSMTKRFATHNVCRHSMGISSGKQLDRNREAVSNSYNTTNNSHEHHHQQQQPSGNNTRKKRRQRLSLPSLSVKGTCLISTSTPCILHSKNPHVNKQRATKDDHLSSTCASLHHQRSKPAAEKVTSDGYEKREIVLSLLRLKMLKTSNSEVSDSCDGSDDDFAPCNDINSEDDLRELEEIKKAFAHDNTKNINASGSMALNKRRRSSPLSSKSCASSESISVEVLELSFKSDSTARPVYPCRNNKRERGRKKGSRAKRRSSANTSKQLEIVGDRPKPITSSSGNKKDSGSWESNSLKPYAHKHKFQAGKELSLFPAVSPQFLSPQERSPSISPATSKDLGDSAVQFLFEEHKH
eukprot:m.226010 g.226010  ORF g.226010 m.226010 type:complete len:923 (-) comp13863_c3_seq1:240-3008(-)